uniref:BZIP domain-containing protein n=1 Tax=Kalanchoe fedtschenkoi TaxID=63787 RepID=A0A7N0TVG2_KALFE
MFPGSFSMMQCNMPSLHFGGFLGSLPSAQILPPLQEFALQPQYSLSNNSTSDEADDQQQHSVIDERRQRRMISNRESARRSRMRKQRHLDELWSQVMRLRNENHSLMERLNNMCESHDKLVQENAKLKEETADFRQLLSTLQIGSPYNALQDLAEVPCNTTSTHSITSSIGMPH